MSEATQCNYCTLRRMRERAKKEGKRLVLMGPGIGEAHLSPSGINVYVVPKSMKIRGRPPEKYFRCWFWELTDHCVC